MSLYNNNKQEADRSRTQPEGSCFYSFYRDLRHLPQLTAGVGTTPIPLHAQLVPSNTSTHFSHHERMESWVNFGEYGDGYFQMVTHPTTNPVQWGLILITFRRTMSAQWANGTPHVLIRQVEKYIYSYPLPDRFWVAVQSNRDHPVSWRLDWIVWIIKSPV